MARPRIAGNGDIMYPEIGKYPPVPDGFVRDEANKYVLHPIFPPCEFRDYKSLPTPCGRKNYHYYCNKSGSPIYTNYFGCCKCKKIPGASLKELTIRLGRGL